jgi:hypothetical protein
LKGIQSIHNKVEMNAILIVKAPKTRKEQGTTPIHRYTQLLSRHVVSQKRVTIQVPLTSLTSRKLKSECHSYHQQAFDKIKKFIGTEMLCTCLLSRIK